MMINIAVIIRMIRVSMRMRRITGHEDVAMSWLQGLGFTGDCGVGG